MRDQYPERDHLTESYHRLSAVPGVDPLISHLHLLTWDEGRAVMRGDVEHPAAWLCRFTNYTNGRILIAVCFSWVEGVALFDPWTTAVQTVLARVDRVPTRERE